MRVHIKTLGCKVNYVESLALEELLLKAGFDVVDEEECDVFILNSCSVTNESDKKSRQALSRNRRLNPDNYSVIMGCYSQVSADELTANKNVNLVSGNMNKLDIVEHLKRNRPMKDNLVGDISKYRVFEALPIHGRGEKTRGFIKIQDGCDNFCTYCIIPFARGHVRSRALKDIENEAAYLKSLGVKEIVITGIEVASYGRDLSGISLIDAIETVARGADGVRIRLSSLEIGAVNEDFLHRLKAIKGFCEHLHLSLQSGTDSTLKRMNRKYTAQGFKEKVELIRKYFPDIGLTTDIIVGFPYETDEDFKKTCDYAREIELSRIHVFPYSQRKNTRAAKMPQVDAKVKTKRAFILREISEELEEKFKLKMLDKEQELLVEERSNGYFYGYTSNYIRAALSTDENPDIKINSLIRVKLIQEGGKNKWIVCSAK